MIVLVYGLGAKDLEQYARAADTKLAELVDD
jgi:hypothetical protein